MPHPCSVRGTKTVADKLQIKPGASVWVDPAERLELIQPLPAEAAVAGTPAAASAVIAFTEDSAELRSFLDQHGALLAERELVWIAYPKGRRSDLARDNIPPLLGEQAMRPIAQVAIDEVWSALRFRPLRPGETFPTGTVAS